MPTRLRALSLPPLPPAASAARRPEPTSPGFGGGCLDDLEAELEALLAAEAAPDGSLCLPFSGEDSISEAELEKATHDPFLSALLVREEMLREQLLRGGSVTSIALVREELESIEALLTHLRLQGCV